MSESADTTYAVKLVIAYDGKSFRGYQKQPGQRTVQGVLGDALRALDPDASELRAASRTDAGVHARGQVVAFDTTRDLPEKGWRMELNKRLPDDVSVRAVARAAAKYDPRFDSTGKLYRYRLHVGVARDPLRDPHSWHVGPSHGRRDVLERDETVAAYLDVDAMREAAATLIGTHDFRAFRAADDVRPNTIRTLTRVDLVTPFGNEPDALAIDVEGSAFMKNMVRILVGTLFEVGRGKRAAASVCELLGATAKREDAGQTAPAHGLCLVRVDLGRAELCRQLESA